METGIHRSPPRLREFSNVNSIPIPSPPQHLRHPNRPFLRQRLFPCPSRESRGQDQVVVFPLSPDPNVSFAEAVTLTRKASNSATSVSASGRDFATNNRQVLSIDFDSNVSNATAGRWDRATPVPERTVESLRACRGLFGCRYDVVKTQILMHFRRGKCASSREI